MTFKSKFYIWKYIFCFLIIAVRHLSRLITYLRYFSALHSAGLFCCPYHFLTCSDSSVVLDVDPTASFLTCSFWQLYGKANFFCQQSYSFGRQKLSVNLLSLRERPYSLRSFFVEKDSLIKELELV